MFKNSSNLRDLESDDDESDTEILVPGGRNKASLKNEIKILDLQDIFSSCLVGSTALEHRMKQNARYDEDYADIQ